MLRSSLLLLAVLAGVLPASSSVAARRVAPAVKLANPFQAKRASRPGASEASLRRVELCSNEYGAEQTYGAVARAALRVFKQFSPQKHFFIGVGRSPTALVAFMQNLNPDIAMNLPASGLQELPTGQLEQSYFDHFAKLIPDAVLKSGKKIVLMDLALRGDSLRSAHAVVQAYLRRRGYKNPLTAIAFTEGANPIYGHDGTAFRNINSQEQLLPLHRIMQFNENGQYPEFHVGVTPKSELRERGYYRQLRKALLARMQSDEWLSDQLRGLK